MIFCVDKASMKESSEVQRDAKLKDIMLHHTKYYPSVEEALKDNYVPLEFCTCVRTVYTNLVMRNKLHENPLYYVDMALSDKVIHKGEDLIMFMSSAGLMHLVDYKDGFDNVMLKFSSFQIIGLYNPGIINPIIVSHVFIADEGVEEFKKFFKKDVTFEPIASIPEEEKAKNLVPILDTLIIVEKENKNEK